MSVIHGHYRSADGVKPIPVAVNENGELISGGSAVTPQSLADGAALAPTDPAEAGSQLNLLAQLVAGIIAAGTAGSPAPDVVSMQGVSGGTPVPISLTSEAMLGYVGGVDYETVAASQSAQMMGATGAVGDYLSHVLIVPATVTPGAVSITDGNGSAITIFAGGSGSVSNLVPFIVPVGAKCVNATTPGWKITTGADVSCIGVGSFT